MPWKREMQADHKNNYVSVAVPKDKQKGGMPEFPFDLNNLLGFQFDQLKLALEYLAR